MRKNSIKKILIINVVFLLILTCASCSKKQLLPGVLTGIGGALAIGGVTYRITLPEDDQQSFLGRQPQQKAGTASLLFTGLALIVAGVIWSATTPHCETNNDCWPGDSCEKTTNSCIKKIALSSSDSFNSSKLRKLHVFKAPTTTYLPANQLSNYQLSNYQLSEYQKKRYVLNLNTKRRLLLRGFRENAAQKNHSKQFNWVSFLDKKSL